MIDITGSIVGTTILLDAVLEIGQFYALSVPTFNQQDIISCQDQTSATYPIYVGGSGYLTIGYVGPMGPLYFNFNGSYCSVVAKNPNVQLFSLQQAQAGNTATLLNYSGSSKTTTGSISEGSIVLVLADPLDFSDGQGVTIAGAGASGTDLLAAQILSGGGSDTLVLNTAASTTVVDAVVYHDDTVSIQNALDAAGKVMGEVKLPASTPQISSTLNIPNGVAFRGESVQGTQIQSYLSPTAANPTFNNWMMNLTDCTNPILADFTLRGPGINAGNGSGITFNLVNNGDVTGAFLQNLFIVNFPGTCLFMDAPVASNLQNVWVQEFAGNGFQLHEGTSCNLSGCYALTGVGYGYLLQSMTYCSMDGCASEGCGMDYYFLSSNNIALNGCGSEEAQYRNSSSPGVHFSFSGSTGITVNSGYARAFPVANSGPGSNQYITVTNGSQVSFDGFRGRSTTTSPNVTYSVDATSTLRLRDCQFDGPNNTLTEVAPGGSLVVQSSTSYILAGSTAGSIVYSMPEQGNFKQFKAFASAYENDTATSQTISFPVSFANSPVVTQNSSGLSVSVSPTELTITTPDSSTTYTGLILIEGV